jgi:hypothetical protein
MGAAVITARVSEVRSLGPVVLEETQTADNQASAAVDVGGPGSVVASPSRLDFGEEGTVLRLFVENGGDGPVAWSLERSDDAQDAVRVSVQGGPASAAIEGAVLPGRGRAVVTVIVDRPGFDAEEHEVLLRIAFGSGQVSVPVAYRDVAGAPGLDHFMMYRAKPSRGAAKLHKFGPVRLANQVTATDYEVLRPLALGLPADKNGEGVGDAETHLAEYALKPAKGAAKLAKRRDVRVVSQCADLLVELKRPASLLVPSAKGLDAPIGAPDPALHEVDHFLCYAASAQRRAADGTKLPAPERGIQVDVVDQLQSRRYDLRAPSKLCVPTTKAGSPVLLAGPDKGEPRPIAPAQIARPEDALVCYRARLATRRIEQDGCGPATPGDRGVAMAKQPRHQKRTGIFVANQLGEHRLDSQAEAELCLPARVPR